MYVPLNVSRHEERVESEIALYGHGIFFCKPRLNHRLHLCAVNPCPWVDSHGLLLLAAAVAAAARSCVSGKDGAAWLPRMNAVKMLTYYLACTARMHAYNDLSK